MKRSRLRLLMLITLLFTLGFALGCEETIVEAASCSDFDGDGIGHPTSIGCADERIDTCPLVFDESNNPASCAAEPEVQAATVTLDCDERGNFDVACKATSDPSDSLAGGQWAVHKNGSSITGQSGGNTFDFNVSEVEPDPCGVYIVSFVPRWAEGYSGGNPQSAEVNFPDSLCPPPLNCGFDCNDVGGGTISCQNETTGVEPFNCDWSFQDGGTSNECGFSSVRHTYPAGLLPATFNVRLAVVDGNFRVCTHSEEVDVAAP